MKSITAFFSLCLILFGFASAIELSNAPSVSERVTPTPQTSTIQSYHGAIKEAAKGVVNISTQKQVKGGSLPNHPILNDPFFRQFFGDMLRGVPKDRIERSLGSGVIISSDGYIITNNHVIDGADKIMVALPNNSREYQAKVIGKDPKSDIAVIKIDAKNLPFLHFANSNDVLVGDVVFAIGNPFGLGETVTQGIVSALNKSGIGINDYENFIQTDASINQGNSGGALIDKGVVERGFLGVAIEDVKSEISSAYNGAKGAVVISVEPNSPAAKAGLKVWDLITQVDNQAIKGANDLRNTIGTYPPDEDIKITYMRDKKTLTTTIRLANANTASNTDGKHEVDGATVSNLDEKKRASYRVPANINGVMVESVRANSKADDAGLQEGDVVIQIENTLLRNASDFSKTMAQLKGKPKRLIVYRQGQIGSLVMQ